MSEEQFKDSLSALPSFDTYKKELDELKHLVHENMSQEEIKNVYHEKAGFLTHPFAHATPEAINKVILYRIRINIPDNQNLNLIRTYSYPDPFFCKSNGRANLKNSTAFYCAENFIIALAEVKPKSGDIGFVSIWSINSDRNVQYSGLFPDNTHVSNRWYSIATQHQKMMLRVAAEVGGDRSDLLRYLFQFNSDLFTKEKEPYLLSSWMANKILYSMDIFDLILYPSYLTEYIATNLAFHPNFVDNYIRFLKVFKFIIDEKKDGTYKIRFAEMGKIEHSTILWQPSPDEEINKYFPGSRRIK